MTPENATRWAQASTVFTPSAPITNRDLFAGRLPQIQKVIDAVNQPGQHAILYGERGVGKTSMANILAPIASAVNAGLISAKVNCDSTDSFNSLWRKSLVELRYAVEHTGPGFTATPEAAIRSLADQLPDPATPNDIRLVLSRIRVPIVLIFDEFDRLPAKVSRAFTDLIKMLSDYVTPATIVLVGVAQTIDSLVKDHASIERALVQIPMPRMEPMELRQILETGAQKLSMSFDPGATSQIVRLSQGRPHYTHSIGLYAVRRALNRDSSEVIEADVRLGVEEAVRNAHESIKNQYHAATASAHKAALFEQVMLACALAAKDQRSYFRASDVQQPLSLIMGKDYEVPAFARHLSEFCTQERGQILERTGPPRRIVYRFTNPLMQPFVLMNGLTKGLLTPEQLATSFT